MLGKDKSPRAFSFLTLLDGKSHGDEVGNNDVSPLDPYLKRRRSQKR